MTTVVLSYREDLVPFLHVLMLMIPSGDACHPMLPYLAQGANSSLEDGAVLGRLLRYVKTEEQILPAVKMYESLRKARSEAIARESMKQVFAPLKLHFCILTLMWSILPEGIISYAGRASAGREGRHLPFRA